jgi:tetratricopeptide (TPR) repeat protein
MPSSSNKKPERRMKYKTIGIAVLLLGSHFLYGEAIRSGADLWKQSEQFYASCLCQSEEIGLDEDTAYLSRKLAATDLELGQYSEALGHVEKALIIYNTLNPSSVKTRLEIVDTRILKGRLLGFLDNYAGAVGELLMVFEDNLAIRGEEDLETIRLYKHLGWHLGRLAKKGGTLEDLDRFSSELSALGSHLSMFEPPEIPQTILSFAQKCYDKALSLDKKTLGETHPETAKSYSLIG